MCVCERACKRAGACERELVRVRESGSVCERACACVRERELVREIVCVCEKARMRV